MAHIKLLNIDTLEDGTIRLQSQLLIGKDSADFILKDGVLMNWRYGERGVNFYPINTSYTIVDDIKDMAVQQM